MKVQPIPKERRIFLAYPFTEFHKTNQIPKIQGELGHLVNAIQKKGIYNVGFCSVYEEEQYKDQGLSWEEIYELTQDEVKTCGRVIGWAPTQNYSKGRENEMIEAFKLDMPLHLIVKKGIKWKQTHQKLIETIRDQSLIDVIYYENLKTDLYRTLINYNFLSKHSKVHK